MKCPACDKEMVTQNFGVNVEVCENGCKGMWFEQGELRMLDEQNEGLGNALEAALRSPRANEGSRGQLMCPKCGIPLHAHRYKRDQQVNIDECYKCGGMFLDSGELTDIRNNYMSDEEVSAYADQLMSGVSGYAEAEKDLAAREQRTEAVRKMTKFLTVNYWRKKFA
jgi:Zn-finger nucleic acid-binding protein